MSAALSGSSVIRHFERSDAIEIRDGITFDFYAGLPHIHSQSNVQHCITVCIRYTSLPMIRRNRHSTTFFISGMASGYTCFMRS